ncbi:MAG: hypothetical protein AAFP76_17505, partial [Bacteroidota bacterium]
PSIKTFIFIFMDGENLDPLNRSMEIISENTGTTTEFMGQQLDTYWVFPTSEPDSKLTMVIDGTKEIDNSALLNKFIQLMMNKSNSSGNMEINLPEGLILSITEPGGELILEAIEIKDTPTTIDLTHSFKITK